MAKPKKERNVLYPPKVVFFKPQGIPLVQLQRVVLNVDEYEAIRLVDYQGLNQERAAKRLGISRPTCARILDDAHRKIAEAITQGKAIQIEGGSFVILKNIMRCRDCGEFWESFGENEKSGMKRVGKKKSSCPQCSSTRVIDLAETVRGGRPGRGFKLNSGGRRGRGRSAG